MKRLQVYAWAFAAALSVLANRTAAQVSPPTPEPLAGGAAAELEKSSFGSLLQLGDGKEDMFLFEFMLPTLIAQYGITKQFSQVLRLCQYWEHVAKTDEDRRMALRCERNALSALGRYSEAETLAARAQLLLPGQTYANPIEELGDLHWLGDINMHQGNAAAAERAFTKLLQVVPVVFNKLKSQSAPQGADPRLFVELNGLQISNVLELQAATQSQLAEIAHFRQDFDVYRARVKALLALPQLDSNAWAINAMTHAQRLDQLGDHEHARELAQRAVFFLKANAGFRDQAEPLTSFQTHLAITNALGDERTQPMHVQGWILLARAYQLLDRDAEAQALLDGTAIIARRYLLEPESANTLLASVEEAQAGLAAKHADWVKAADLLRAARSRLEKAQTIERSSERGRRGLTLNDPLLQVDAKLLTALSRSGVVRVTEVSQVEELAAIASEFSSSRAGLSAVLSSRAATSAEQQTALDRESRLIDEMVDLRGATMSSLHSTNSTQAQASNRAVARLTQIYDELARLKASMGIGAANSQMTAANFAKRLGPSIAYWQWLTHADGNFVLCWTQDGVAFAPLTASYQDIRSDVVKLRANVDLSKIRLRSQVPPYSRKRAHTVYRALFNVVPASISNTRSWILAASPLVDGLPWGALWLREPELTSSEPGWLIERADLTVVPSWKGWLALRSRPAASGSMDLLAVGDPILPSAPKPLAEELDVRGAYVAKTLELPVVHSKKDSTFAQELREVSALFPARRTLVLTQGEATKAKLGTLRLSDFQTILFSTHGHLGQKFAMSIGPSLQLTANSSVAGSRYLSAGEVAKFQLDANLVILSACDTSGSDGFDDSEGLSGLTSAFLLAGARNVVATLWPVETETTKSMITATIRNRVEGGEPTTAARALQRATINLLRSGADWQQHPAYWAPFIVVGM